MSGFDRAAAWSIRRFRDLVFDYDARRHEFVLKGHDPMKPGTIVIDADHLERCEREAATEPDA